KSPDEHIPIPNSILTIVQEPSELNFSEMLSEQGLINHAGIAGVQAKASASMISLPVKHRGESYILKLTPEENPYLVENEFFFLKLAKRLKLDVADAEIIRDRHNQPGLLIT